MRSVWVLAVAAMGASGCVPDPGPYGAYVPGSAPVYAGGPPGYSGVEPGYAGPVTVPSTAYYGAGYAPYAAGPVVVPGAVGLVEFGGGGYRGYDDRRYDRDDRGYPGGYRGGYPGGYDRHPAGGYPGGYDRHPAPPPSQPPVARGPAPQPQQRIFPNAQPGTHIVQEPTAPRGQGWVVPNGRVLHSPNWPPS